MPWTLIEHASLSTNQSSVTLGSGGTIPQTYKALKIVFSVRTDRTDYADSAIMRLNGDATAGNYLSRSFYGVGSTTGSNAASDTNLRGPNGTGASATSTTFGNAEALIPNYSGSTVKAISIDGVSENNAANAFALLSALLWTQTNAVTSLVFVPEVGTNFVSGSTFTLYGLK